MGALPDSRKQRAQHPATTKLLEREAVPDVALVLARRDGQLDLADPFGLRGEPTVSGKLIANPRPETSAPPGKPRCDEIALGFHGRGNHGHGSRGRSRRNAACPGVPMFRGVDWR